MSEYEEKNLDQRISDALEIRPSVVIPRDFALRVMRQLPAHRAPSRIPLVSSPGIGRRVTFAAAFVLLLAMLIVSLLARHNIALQAVEGSLATEFILLSLWMSLRPQTLR